MLRLLIVVFTSLLAVPAAGNAPAENLLLQPTMEQRFTTSVATKLLTNWHYKETLLNDDRSATPANRGNQRNSSSAECAGAFPPAGYVAQNVAW